MGRDAKNIEDLAKSGGLENGMFPQNLLIFLLCRQPPELSEGYHHVSEIIKFRTSPQIVSRPVFPPSLVRSRQTASGSIANNFTILQFHIMAGWSLTNKHFNNLNIYRRKQANATSTLQNGKIVFYHTQDAGDKSRL